MRKVKYQLTSYTLGPLPIHMRIIVDYRHCTVFAPKHCLYQKKATGRTAQKCLPLVGGETPLICACWQTTPSHGWWYRSQNENLHKLGWTYRHGTMFAPRQCLYQKKATGMESPEMYSTSRCRNPTYLCGPASYPISWRAVYGREQKLA